MWNGLCTSWNFIVMSSVWIFGERIPSPTLLFLFLYNFSPHWTTSDSQMQFYNKYPILLFVPTPLLTQLTLHRHGHGIPSSSPKRPILVLWPSSSLEHRIFFDIHRSIWNLHPSSTIYPLVLWLLCIPLWNSSNTQSGPTLPRFFLLSLV